MAIVIAIAAAVLRLAFLQQLGLRVTFVTFYPAVILAALYGGLGPGLLATGLSALLADYFWMEPVGTLRPNDLADTLGLGIFCASGGLVCFVTEAMHRARARAAVAEEQARQASEREQVQQALRQTEERLAAFGAATFEGIALSDRGRIVDLTARMDRQGRLAWDVPPGKWTIVRFGRTSTGAVNAPAPASGRSVAR